MLGNRKIRFALLLLALVGLTLGVVAGEVFGTSAKQVVTPAAVAHALADGAPAQVAAFPHEPGVPDRNVYLERSDGLLCLWDAPDATQQGGGGCNEASDPFGGRKMMFSLAWDGGPSLGSVHGARIYGIVASDVAGVELRMSDGSTRTIALHGPARDVPYRAFAYRIRQSDVRAGVQPVAAVARDASGRAVDRQATGFE